MERLWLGLGALFGLGAVAMSAFVAHGTGALPAASVQALRDAVQMQGWHALVLVALGLWGRRAGLAGAAFAIGTLMFCGAVYAQRLAGMHLPQLAPVGGFVLMGGWLLLALRALRR
jgi:hypothetical protein